MALIQFGPTVSAIKGSIGGVTFSKNSAGNVAKSRSTGRRSQSAKAKGSINTSNEVTANWVLLSSAVKGLWVDYAEVNVYTDRFGTVKILTGFQFYKSLGNNLLFFTGNILGSPPAFNLPTPLPTFTVVLSATDIVITWSVTVDTGLFDFYIFTTAPTRQLSNRQRSGFRLTPAPTGDLSVSFSLINVWNATHNLDYASIFVGGKFNINVMMVPVRKTSLNSTTSQRSVGST